MGRTSGSAAGRSPPEASTTPRVAPRHAPRHAVSRWPPEPQPICGYSSRARLRGERPHDTRGVGQMTRRKVNKSPPGDDVRRRATTVARPVPGRSRSVDWPSCPRPSSPLTSTPSSISGRAPFAGRRSGSPPRSLRRSSSPRSPADGSASARTTCSSSSSGSCPVQWSAAGSATSSSTPSSSPPIRARSSIPPSAASSWGWPSSAAR